jgi:hypothetical protein
MSKEKEIVELLMARTKAGTKSWEPMAREDEFATVVGEGFSIFVRALEPRERGDDTPDYELILKDNNDRDVLSIYNAGEDVEWKDLQVLHDTARRSALKVDASIDAVLRQLKKQG